MNILKNSSVLNIKIDATKLAIDLDDVKNFLKVDFNDDDDFITRLIKTASAQCETNINKTLVERTYVYSLYELRKQFIVLPYQPIKSIENISLTKMDGSILNIEDENYDLDIIGGIVNFKSLFDNFYRLDIEYKAGLSNIGDELIHAMLMHIARMYEDRSGYSAMPLSSMNIYKKYREVRL